MEQPKLGIVEWEALISYHLDQEYENAKNQCYSDADYHHKRTKELKAYLEVYLATQKAAIS